jgi:hypothetical protein
MSSQFKDGLDRIRRTFLGAHPATLSCTVCETIDAVIDAAILGKGAELYVRWNRSMTCAECPALCTCLIMTGIKPCNDFAKHQNVWIEVVRKEEGIT